MSGTDGTVTLGACQISEVYHDKEATIEKDCRYIREAGDLGVDLLVFPEFHVAANPWWYWWDDEFDDFRPYYRKMFENAVEVPGQATDRICDAAEDAGVALDLGANEREPDTAGTMYNSQVFVDSDGSLLGVRRKLVPTRHERIFHTGGSGKDISTFDSSLGTLGGLMCGEHTNPLAIFANLARGEEIHAASWPAMAQAPRDQAFRERTIVMRTRYNAFAGRVPTACATGVVTDELAEAVGGLPETWPDSGTSCILAPDGEYLAGPKWDGEGIVHADVDMGERIEGKAYHDVVGHYNRFDVFELRINDTPHTPVAMRSESGNGTDVESAGINRSR